MIEVKNRLIIIDQREYQVPTNVSRLCVKGYEGWSVRFSTKPEANSVFNDRAYQGTEGSLAAATEYANKHRPPHKLRIKPGKGIKLVTRTTVLGVVVSWEVYGLAPGEPSETFIIGVEESGLVTDKLKARILVVAQAHRAKLIAKHKQEVARRRLESTAHLNAIHT